MAEDILTPNEEVVETIPAPEPLPEEKSHSWQPTDEHGRPMGGRQVIKYRTHEELVEKMQEQSTHLLRKLREQTRKVRLGITEDTSPEDAPKIQEPIEFKPRKLSDEERVRLSRDLLDPDQFESATETLFEATLGAKPKALIETITDLTAQNMRRSALEEVERFKASNPGYFICQENSEAITAYMVRHNWAPVQANFQRAFDELGNAGVLVERPAPVVGTVAQSSVPEPAQQTVPPSTPDPVPGISSGLTRSMSANTGTPPPTGSDIIYEVKINGQVKRFVGKQAIDAMPADEYKRRLVSDPTFSKKVEKLEQDAETRRRK